MTWLDHLKGYLSGRAPELDSMFVWAEGHTVAFTRSTDYGGCLDCTRPEQVWQQCWALLGLVKADGVVKRTFAKVPRHNGF